MKVTMMMMTTMMTTTSLLPVILVAAILLSAANGFSVRSKPLVNSELMHTLRTMRRGGSQCLGSGSKCFNSVQCCQGFVCASFYDFSGENPEVPGYCVKEKDLQLCEEDNDCTDVPRSVCISIGPTRQSYCLAESIRNEVNPVASLIIPRKTEAPAHTHSRSGRGRLGSACLSSIDCNPFTDSNAPLCCKDVPRGRQGIKRMCDKRETPAPCI